QVQRLSGPGFSDIPSAATQATLSDQELRRQAQQWGEELHQAGVTVDLAPVADVVPASVGEQSKPSAARGRGYGSDPQQVSEKVTAFIKGMAAAGEATAVKHFPGLGTVTGNTDFADHVVDTTTTRDSELLTGFDAAIEAGANMVMISTAYYAEIDPDHPAAFSHEVITGMLRKDRGYDGVVISDDLGAAKAVADWAPGERAVKFLQAGGDLIINVEPASTDDMIDAVLVKAKQDPDLPERVDQAARRLLDLKTQLGLTDCDSPAAADRLRLTGRATPCPSAACSAAPAAAHRAFSDTPAERASRPDPGPGPPATSATPGSDRPWTHRSRPRHRRRNRAARARCAQ